VRNRLYIERKWGASTLSLMPRIGGYLVRGLRNGHTAPTLRAIADAIALPLNGIPHLPSIATRDYLRSNDRVHRGSMLRRLNREVLGLIGAEQPAHEGGRLPG
jgi:hypothetical protein